VIDVSQVGSGPYVNIYIHKDSVTLNNSVYYYNGGNDNYISGTDTFKLTSNIDTGSVGYAAVGGIMTDDNTLDIDFDTKDITVINTNGSGQLTAGFGYVSDTAFGGTLNATNASNSTYSVTASSGSALGFVFVETNRTTFVDLDSATIDLSDTTINVTNNSTGAGQAVGFAAGDLTNNSNIKIGNIDVENASPNTETYGFLAGDVTDSSVLEIGDVEINAKYHSYAVALDKIQSNVTVGNIDIETTDNAGNAYGFHVKSIDGNGDLNIGTIDINSVGNGTGFFISHGYPDFITDPIVLSGTVAIGDIDVTSTNRAIGFYIEDDTTTTGTDAPKITGTVTLNKISVESTGNETAIGVSLGAFTSNSVDLGSAAAGSLVLNGDITAISNDYVLGVHAGQLEGLDVKKKISAETTHSTYWAYGIYTRGYTENTDNINTQRTKNSVINIKDGASIFAKNGTNGSTNAASIAMGSVDKDVVNIDAGITTWTNGGEAFTLSGVEELNVTEDSVADLSGTDSLRGRATLASVDTVTNVAGELKVKDTFFNAVTTQPTNKSNINVTGSGKLELVSSDNTQNLSGGRIDKLTINGTNAVVTIGDKAELEFTSPTDAISVTDGKLKIANTAGIFTTDQKIEYANSSSGDLSTAQLELKIENGTIEVTKDTSDPTKPLFAVGLKTTVTGEATIDVADSTEISIGNVTHTGASADLTKTGLGTMTLNHKPAPATSQKWSSLIDLGTGTLDIQAGTVQVMPDSSFTAAYEIKANVNVASGAAFTNVRDNEVQINALTGGGTVNIANAAGSLNVKSGTFTGTITGNGSLKKESAGILTLAGNNTATGSFSQTGGTVNLQKTWNGRYKQSIGTTLNLSNDSKIVGNADLSGTVDITNGKLDVGGNLHLESSSTLKMTVAADKINATNIKIDGDIDVDWSNVSSGSLANVITGNIDPATQSKLAAVFTVDSLLVSLSPTFSGGMSIQSSVQKAADYMTVNRKNFRKNQIRVAELFDGYAPAQAKLQSFTTSEQLEDFVKGLLAPELAADARELPLNQPYFRIFNHIHNLPTSSYNANSGTLYRGQSTHSRDNNIATQGNHEFWFEGYYQGGETNGDSNALGYKTSRGGMMIGVDQYFGDGLLTGLVFGYGNPRVYNSTGKIEADDFTFGVYSRLKVLGIYANTFLGYGSQNYQLRQNQTQHTKFNGDSFYASLELFKPIYLRNDMLVSPLVAIDFQKSWSDGFNTNNAVPLTVKKGEMDQTVLRLGVNSNYRNWRTRLQYGYQIAGDLYSTSRTSITGSGNNRVLSGVNLGRHTFNAGFGGDFQFGIRTILFADYDLDLGERATAHTGQFGFVGYF
jgi:uncharacterized protein with beta-barrel porin domain